MARIRGGPRGGGRNGGRAGGRHGNNNEDQEARPDQMQQLMGMMMAQQNTLNELRNDLREVQQKQNADVESRNNPGGQIDSHAQPPEPEPEVPEGPIIAVTSMQTWVTRFNKHQPPVFRGKIEPHTAEDWLSHLQKIFKILECPDDVKVRLAIYKLEGDADKWWGSTEPILQARHTPITWAVFQKNFNEKYFPRSVRLAKETEFLAIQQGEKESFDEYLARYIRLSRYSSYLKNHDNEELKSDMMIRGLK